MSLLRLAVIFSQLFFADGENILQALLFAQACAVAALLARAAGLLLPPLLGRVWCLGWSWGWHRNMVILGAVEGDGLRYEE